MIDLRKPVRGKGMVDRGLIEVSNHACGCLDPETLFKL
jgi:hypothetical protein